MPDCLGLGLLQQRIGAAIGDKDGQSTGNNDQLWQANIAAGHPAGSLLKDTALVFNEATIKTDQMAIQC
ncbi:hypothetical protein SIN8267_02086 [Sinobacterium norvegicum]|uniref:Uncharacterized protein n=1 Tax=Sinobacterium norvegicum TaxID=1641715 RepID=A0ABM9AGU4_9GAMM|nr:hypothetical protein [Sinobacterium norvegicum]CAH0991971.1 hypothetical protein SIN8267_02086 [Sinobacterium norvegicum]